MPSDKIILPDAVGEWRLEGPPRRIDETNIFEYMNGGGELYLSYHFGRLLVYEYKDREDNDLLVEIYFMKESRDAFGLLSLDWGGEAVVLNAPEDDRSGTSVVPPRRALYGQGLLRAWSDNVYVRIIASRDKPGVKDVILRLGKTIAAGRSDPPRPELFKAVRPAEDSPWQIRKDRTAYFYSHLVLNSLYYLSHENILNLGADTEAVLVTFEKEQVGEAKRAVRLLVIAYPDRDHASKAWEDFSAAYLPDRKGRAIPGSGKENQGLFSIEDGWLGTKLVSRHLALAFECPDPESAREILSRSLF